MNAREEFTAIVRHLSSIKELVEHYIKAKEEEWNRQHEREKIPVQVTDTFGLPEAIEAQRATNQERYHTTQKTIAVAAWAAFVAALTYAVIAQLQFEKFASKLRSCTTKTRLKTRMLRAGRRKHSSNWQIAQKQANAAQDGVAAIQKQMEGDQRAWITIQSIKATSLEGNKPTRVEVEILNTGKSVNKVGSVAGFIYMPTQYLTKFSRPKDIREQPPSALPPIFPNSPN